jgi:serine protease Do
MDEELYLGEAVYAVGNPKGDKTSVTQGIISKDSEYISVDIGSSSKSEDYYSLRVLRTDAAINGGNSGGGLFNSKGQIVGIVNARSVSTEIENMGYALPAATSRRVVQNIIDNYKSAEYHGIYRAYIDTTTKIVASSSIFDNTLYVTKIIEDVAVDEVVNDSKFARDLNTDDIIKNITISTTDSNGNTTVKESMDIIRMHNITDVMLDVRAGDTVTITINRSGTEMSISKTYSASDLELCD